MEGQTLARIGAIVFVAIAITVAVIDLSRTEDTPAGAIAPMARSIPAPGPLQAELARCTDMGEAATRDRVCLKVWADSRRHFLGQDGGR